MAQKDMVESIGDRASPTPISKLEEELQSAQTDVAPSMSSTSQPDTPVASKVASHPEAAASGWGSWGSFMQKAASGLVNKSAEMVEFIKKDLTEFTEAMQKDTAIIVNDATQTLKSKVTMEEANKAADLVKTGISSFFGSINASLSVFDDAQEDTTPRPDRYSRSQARLAAIQEDVNTYKKEPSGRPEDYESWLESFDIAKRREEMDRLLDRVNSVQEAYNGLVPLTVSHNEFWQRYFYKAWQLEVDEKRIQSLMARSSGSSPAEMDWDDDSSGILSFVNGLCPIVVDPVLVTPSEVSSVVSNESFQMVNHDADDDHTHPSGLHSKKESLGSLGDWEQATDSDEERAATTAVSAESLASGTTTPSL